MFALPLVIALMMEPAQFKIEVEANTEVILLLDGNKLKAGQTYQTKPLLGEKEIEVEVRWLNGDRIMTQTIPIRLVPGCRTIFLIKIETCKPIVMVC